MKHTRLNRPTTRFERPLLWIISAVIILIACGLGTLLAFGIIQVFVPEPRTSLFVLAAGLGIIALAPIAIAFLYSLRKREFQERAPGSMMSWLQSHVYIGGLSLTVVLLHIWVPSFSAGLSTGKLALIVLLLLVVSGVAWRIVYEVVPPRVAQKVGNLSVSDTQDKTQMARVEMDKALAGKSAEFRQAAEKRLKGQPLAVVENGLRLPSNEHEDWKRFGRLAERLERYTHRWNRQRYYAQFLQGWKRLHIPLAAILAGLVIIHGWDALRLSHVVIGGEMSGLPSASACASCHPGVVEEWRLAMHSQAQTNPIAIAQTNLALEKYPKFARACNNCHAPVGTALTGTPTLPLDANNVLRPHPNGEIIDDGVTCIVCHTLAEAPEERRGLFDDFPVALGSANQFADMFGPLLSDPPPVANPRHHADTGFMTDNVSSSQLCGACHNVKVDIDGDGEVTAFPGSEGADTDTDGDGRLDENELEVAADGKTLEDLVIQTTYDEWENYVAAERVKGQGILGCVDCHMPSQPDEPAAASVPGSFFVDGPARDRRSHTFTGVDYNLTPGFYEQLGMPANARQRVLEERESLLKSAAELAVSTTELAGNQLSAMVTIDIKLIGHSLPTGFVFARQMWLEVSAHTASGREICLDSVDVSGRTIAAQCASGKLEAPQDNLKTCDPLALADLGLKPSKNGERIALDPASAAPLEACDPWLANFQHILTDGDPDGDGIFSEVPYQSARADILKTQVRVSDQQPMDALNPTILVDGQPRKSASFEYIFDLGTSRGEEIIVSAVLRFRHLPPYFVRALDGGYPGDLTAADLLENMTVVEMTDAETKVP